MKLNVALIYDSFLENGGGERSALITAKTLEAEIFTTYFDREKIKLTEDMEIPITECGLTFKNHKILTFTESAFRLRKWLKKNEKELKRNFDVFLVSGMYGASASFLHPNCFLCLSPPRALYSDFEIVKKRLNFPFRQIFQLWVEIYKKYDKKWVEEFDKILAISDVVKHRIQTYYGRKSFITYLPIEVKKYKWKKSEGYWFCPNRLNEEKRIELVVKAFQKLDKKLVIAGDGINREKILSMIKGFDNISYVGNLSYDQIIEWYSRCEGVICMARNEDLGLVPLEAMASGKPTIVASDGGGLTETVIQNVNGWIVLPTEKALAERVKKITAEETERMRKNCEKLANFFDVGKYSKRVYQNLLKVVTVSFHSSIQLSKGKERRKNDYYEWIEYHNKIPKQVP